MRFHDVIEITGRVIEGTGVAVMVLGALLTSLLALRALVGRSRDDIYRTYRRRLGRAILLGLEFLVAGDIIRTVAVDPTFGDLGLLAGIVLVRTFLSFALEVEIEGRWPWQHRREDGGSSPAET